MFGWFILAFIIAVVVAAIHGVRSAGRAIRDRYRAKRQLAREAVDAGLAPKALSRGNKAGMAIGATITGPGLTMRALAAGLRIGWRAGRRWVWRRRARARIDRRNAERAAATATATATATTTTAPASPPPTAHPVSDRPVAGRPRRATSTATTGGTTTVPIETKTNGEIRTREQLEQELKATVAEATAELEDTQAAMQAIDDEAKRVDAIAASLVEFEIDTATRTAVMGIVDPTHRQKAAHQERLAAADLKRAAAQNALDTFLAAKQTKFHANAS